jgi:uncharacterized protein (DUF983 family)
MTTNPTAKDAILKYGLKCRCPRCGQGRLFNGFLALAPRCEVCDLDFSFADPADGPAFFVMMTMAIPATAVGVWIELAYEPALWVHLLTTLPFLLLSCVPTIRLFKGMLVASQYFHKAEEGRFEIPQQAAAKNGPKPPPDLSTAAVEPVRALHGDQLGAPGTVSK